MSIVIMLVERKKYLEKFKPEIFFEKKTKGQKHVGFISFFNLTSFACSKLSGDPLTPIDFVEGS